MVTSYIQYGLHILLLLVSITFEESLGLNIDVRSPTVVSSGLGDGESVGFGFSLAQHVFSDGRQVALVGAPKSDGAQYPREGGFLMCPFVHGGSCLFESASQSLQNANPELFILPLSSLNVSYIGQLMGYSLKSFGDYVVSCAPLYIHRLAAFQVGGVTYHRGDPNGRCIIIDRDLDPNSVLQLSSVDINPGALKLAGIDTAALEMGGSEHLAVGSALSGEANTPNGQVFLKELNRTSGGYAPGVTLSSPRGTAPVVPLTGYHLDTGYFTVDPAAAGPKQIITSAPRSDSHFGKVEILTVGVQLSTAYILRGKEADGYYGYDFAALDLGTEGGYHSIVVGCPLCDRERGRVYVYTHTGDINNPFVESSIPAPGSGTVPGRFGLAVENIGDIDQDGLSDMAISAPYEGSGVVYVFRGSESGLVANDYEVIPATPGSLAFGYTISGGLDIDSNGYPDFTVTELSGSHVTSFRATPLVNVTLSFRDEKLELDLVGDSDRLCPIRENVNLQCFNVTPCFYFQSKHGNVSEFALSYTLTVDATKGRAGLYLVQDGQPMIRENSITETISIPSPGSENVVCPHTYTFALTADFTETAPIPVLLNVSDSPDPVPLVSASDDQFGGPLHPVLQRYSRGDTPATLSLEHQVVFNVNCSGGNSSSECEPQYQLHIEDYPSPNNLPVLVLAAGNEFGYRVNLTNTGEDDGLNPTLVVQFPNGVIYNRSESISSSAITECNTRRGEQTEYSAIECKLRNPVRAGKRLELIVYFILNVSAVSLEKREISFNFSVAGSSEEGRREVERSVELDAVGAYELTSLVTEGSYQALRRTLFRNSTHLPLNETGPLVNLRIVAQNSRHESNGTVFARSSLIIHIPVEIVNEDGTSKPLIIPTEVVAVGNINCSHYGAIPEGLSSVQVPSSFVPPWVGPRPPADPRCEREGQYKCGVIICTIFDLAPPPAPPTQLTILSRLFSPSVVLSQQVGVYSVLSNDNELPRLGEDNQNSSEVFFDVVPAITEVARDCIPYWIVVVSVVIGIFALVVIITVLGFCGIFRRWYKVKQEEATWETANGNDQTDSDYVYHRRTIPPIAGISTAGGGVSDKEKEAEEEFEAERVKLQEFHASPVPSESKESLEKFQYDPSKGVDDNAGEETEL